MFGHCTRYILYGSLDSLEPKAIKVKFSISVELEENFFVDRHKEILRGVEKNITTFRTLYYPKLNEDEVRQPRLSRCGAHSDYGTISLLFQDENGGLEVNLGLK